MCVCCVCVVFCVCGVVCGVCVCVCVCVVCVWCVCVCVCGVWCVVLCVCVVWCVCWCVCVCWCGVCVCVVCVVCGVCVCGVCVVCVWCVCGKIHKLPWPTQSTIVMLVYVFGILCFRVARACMCFWRSVRVVCVWMTYNYHGGSPAVSMGWAAGITDVFFFLCILMLRTGKKKNLQGEKIQSRRESLRRRGECVYSCVCACVVSVHVARVCVGKSWWDGTGWGTAVLRGLSGCKGCYHHSSGLQWQSPQFHVCGPWEVLCNMR